MAAGSVTILSDLPWVRELITPGRDAFVVAARPEEVAVAIEQILRTPDLRMRMVASARTLVERHRDRTVELDRLETCYRELAPQH
jgi:glycosyltransferase involved in cell wall biosynthesis